MSNDFVTKIKEAQDRFLCNIRTEVNNEIIYISSKFHEELQNSMEKILLNPFNMYISIPRTSKNNDKIYLEELKKQYSKNFHHDLQISEGNFLIIVKHHTIICDGDPRPKMLMEKNDEPIDYSIFNDNERKKFEEELASPALCANSSSKEFKRPSIRSGFAGEKKDILTASTTHGGLVPLFLQRRNSKMALPSISARRVGTRQVEVSVSDNNQEETSVL